MHSNTPSLNRGQICGRVLEINSAAQCFLLFFGQLPLLHQRMNYATKTKFHQLMSSLIMAFSCAWSEWGRYSRRHCCNRKPEIKRQHVLPGGTVSGAEPLCNLSSVMLVVFHFGLWLDWITLGSVLALICIKFILGPNIYISRKFWFVWY